MTKKLIKDYIQLKNQFDEIGGPEKSSQMFEQILEMEETILNTFGLPPTKTNIEYLRILKSETEINACIEKLNKLAAQYLLSSPLSPLEILANAQKKELNAFDVLPEIKVNTNSYTTFVYDEMLIKEGVNSKLVLKEYEILESNDISSRVFLLQRLENPKTQPEYKELKKFKLRYLDSFLDSQQEEILSEETNNSREETGFHLFEITLVKENLFRLVCKNLSSNNEFIIYASNLEVALIFYLDAPISTVEQSKLSPIISDNISSLKQSKYILSLFKVPFKVINNLIKIYSSKPLMESIDNAREKIFHVESISPILGLSVRKEESDRIAVILKLITNAFRKHLLLKGDNKAASQAAKESGLGNEILFEISSLLFSSYQENNLINAKEVKNYVHYKLTTDVSDADLNEILEIFRNIWGKNPGRLVGDSDYKNSVYQVLERKKNYIPQHKVDTIIDLALQYFSENFYWTSHIK